MSLADSVAAFLQRRPDSTEKPNTFVRVGLRERGIVVEDVDGIRKHMLEETKARQREVIEIITHLFSKDRY